MVFKRKSKIDEMPDGPTMEEVNAEIEDALVYAETAKPSPENEATRRYYADNDYNEREASIKEWSFELLRATMASRNMKCNNAMIDEMVTAATYLADKLGLK